MLRAAPGGGRGGTGAGLTSSPAPASAAARRCPGPGRTGWAGAALTPQLKTEPGARLGSVRLPRSQQQGQPLAREPSAALLRSGPVGPGSGWCGAPCPASRAAWEARPPLASRLGLTAGLPAGRAERTLCSPSTSSLAGILCQVLVGE
ncbi:unnamed protein product [Coccothraustes coccothraustes]